ncbi:MAG TPA: GAF domain-containing protein [Anaerolineae bacterium]
MATATVNTIAIVIAVTLVAASASGFVVVRRIVRPIEGLAVSAQRIASGDLSHSATVTSRDEIGTLAITFNSMTAQLRDLIGSLEARVEARTAQLQAGIEVGRAVTSILKLDQLIRTVVDLLARRFDFYFVAVFTLDASGTFAVLRAATGLAGRTLGEGDLRLEVGGPSLVSYAIAQRKSRIMLDIDEDPLPFTDWLLPNTRSEIALPLIVGDRVLGALDVQSTRQAAFDESTAAVLQNMADQVAIALNNAALFDETQRSVKALNDLLVVSTDIALSRTLSDLTSRALRHIETLMGTRTYYLALVDEQEKEVRFVMRSREDSGTSDTLVTRAFGNGRTEHVIRTRQPLRMSTYEAPVRLERLGLNSSAERPAAFLGVPIILGERVVGMLGFEDFSAGAAFSEFQERIAQALADQLAVTLENLRLTQQAQRTLADLDAANRLLTGRAWGHYTRMARIVAGEWYGGRWVTQPAGAENAAAFEASSPGALTIPVTVRGQTIGEFSLLPLDESMEWLPEDVTFAQSLIDQVGQVLETARLLEETERLAGRERTINEINSRVRQTVSIDTILQTAVNELGRSLRAARIMARIGQPVAPTPDGDSSLTGDLPGRSQQ